MTLLLPPFQPPWKPVPYTQIHTQWLFLLGLEMWISCYDSLVMTKGCTIHSQRKFFVKQGHFCQVQRHQRWWWACTHVTAVVLSLPGVEHQRRETCFIRYFTLKGDILCLESLVMRKPSICPDHFIFFYPPQTSKMNFFLFSCKYPKILWYQVFFSACRTTINFCCLQFSTNLWWMP